ncbi:MAG: Radical SAM domain protein, partial [uncultured Thermomicrobiales bacterium]
DLRRLPGAGPPRPHGLHRRDRGRRNGDSAARHVVVRHLGAWLRSSASTISASSL